ncbi:MAG: hypothetical protein RLZZ124_1257 [Cyanobacteriota bacterium]
MFLLQHDSCLSAPGLIRRGLRRVARGAAVIRPGGPDVLVGPCPLGRGLFAARPFRAGERILVFRGPEIDFRAVVAKGEAEANPLQIGPDRYLDIDAPAVCANHSCRPNAGIVNDRVLMAIAPIRSGEEIRYDYSTTMWEGHWTLPCACGSPDCRGVVDDFPTLPADLQRRYLRLGIVQRFIVRGLQRSSAPDQVRSERASA